MPVQRSRHSKKRRDQSRAHYKLAVPNVVACPKCGEPKMPHRICPSCGEYKGASYHVIVTKK